jgi:hypothetical protein
VVLLFIDANCSTTGHNNIKCGNSMFIWEGGNPTLRGVGSPKGLLELYGLGGDGEVSEGVGVGANADAGAGGNGEVTVLEHEGIGDVLMELAG